MTMRRRFQLARSAQVDLRIVKDVAAAQRRRSDGRYRIGITYPLRDGADEARALEHAGYRRVDLVLEREVLPAQVHHLNIHAAGALDSSKNVPSKIQPTAAP